MVESNGYIRAGYIGGWARRREGRAKFTPDSYEPGLCTHIIFAFGVFGDDYKVKAHHPDDTEPGSGGYALVNSLKSRDSKLKTILSIGGKVFGTERFKELRAAIEQEAFRTGHKRLILTADVAPEKRRIENGYDVHKIEEYLDFVMVMSYDFHGPWEQRTGFNSPLYSQDGLSVHDAATSWESQGMRNCKIVIGIPLYGRGWTLSNSSNTDVGAAGTPSRPTRYICESGVASYYEIREMLASGAQNRWNDEQQVPYLVQDDQWFSYDDEKSVTKKMQYIKKRGYGGAFVWTLDFDDFNGQSSDGRRFPIMSTIVKELRG